MGCLVVGEMAVDSWEEAVSLTGPRIEVEHLGSRCRLDGSSDMPSDVRTGGDSHKPMEAIHGTPCQNPHQLATMKQNPLLHVGSP